MSDVRQQLMKLMDELEKSVGKHPDPRVQKAVRKALRGLSALFQVLLVVD